MLARDSSASRFNETDGRRIPAMARIRILVVDDSVVIRKLLCRHPVQAIRNWRSSAQPATGSIALAKIAQLHPDLVTLDVEMPVMNGLETLAEMRKLYPKLPVIMFSTLTERGAVGNAGCAGARRLRLRHQTEQYGQPGRRHRKPSATELIPKIKALCGARRPEAQVAAAAASRRAGRRPAQPARSRLWPSAPRPAAPMRWRKSCREFPKIFRFPSWWCSTCRRFLPGCWPSGWRASREFRWRKAAPGVTLARHTPGSRRETST